MHFGRLAKTWILTLSRVLRIWSSWIREKTIYCSRLQNHRTFVRQNFQFWLWYMKTNSTQDIQSQKCPLGMNILDMETKKQKTFCFILQFLTKFRFILDVIKVNEMEIVNLQLVRYPYKRNKLHQDPLLRQFSLE